MKSIKLTCNEMYLDPTGLLGRLLAFDRPRLDQKYVLKQKLSSELLNPAHGVGFASWVEVRP